MENMGHKTEPVASLHIDHTILLIRGQRVLLDRDLAAMYGVIAGNLNKAVRRNLSRFPSDFMFQLTAAEVSRSQLGIFKRGLTIKHLPNCLKCTLALTPALSPKRGRIKRSRFRKRAAGLAGAPLGNQHDTMALSSPEGEGQDEDGRQTPFHSKFH